MRALAINERGAEPAVQEVDDLLLAAGQIRVATGAASVNGFDVAVAAGYVWDAMAHTFPVVLGRDFAGTVVAVGPDVDGVEVGDRVAGVNMASTLGPGMLAEQVVVDSSTVTVVPASVTDSQATGVGLAGVTAGDIVAALEISSGDVVFVSGATGGVGAFAVQLLASQGAHVIGSARPGAASEFVRGLGAADVVDYSGDLFTAISAVAPNGVTKVLHAAGDAPMLARLLASGGQLASLRGATAEQVGRGDVTVTAVSAKYTPEKLRDLLALLAAGGLTVPVGGTYALADAATALVDFSGAKLGKVIVTMP